MFCFVKSALAALVVSNCLDNFNMASSFPWLAASWIFARISAFRSVCRRSASLSWISFKWSLQWSADISRILHPAASYSPLSAPLRLSVNTMIASRIISRWRSSLASLYWSHCIDKKTLCPAWCASVSESCTYTALPAW